MSAPPVVINVPRHVISNANGYDFLCIVAEETIDLLHSQVIVDFTYCEWFDGNLCAPLGCILMGAKSQRNDILLRNLSDSLKETLVNNNFISSIGNFAKQGQSLSIPFTSFDLEDEIEAVRYIESQLFEKADMPAMSVLAKKAIIESIFEICVNALTHGGCDKVFICGQFFPKANPPRVSISFADLGRTIKTNVNEHLKMDNSGNKTILWALEEGNTTKKNKTGGIGFSTLKTLINANKGSLQVVSADGFIEYRYSINKEIELERYFPGTVITLRILLNDPNFYYLDEEVDIENIFSLD